MYVLVHVCTCTCMYLYMYVLVIARMRIILAIILANNQNVTLSRTLFVRMYIRDIRHAG
jgi:hypothetical protein